MSFRAWVILITACCITTWFHRGQNSLSQKLLALRILTPLQKKNQFLKDSGFLLLAAQCESSVPQPTAGMATQAELWSCWWVLLEAAS